MVWAKVDDGMWKHRKFMLLSMPARGLWVTALSYCGMECSDHIPESFLTMACAAVRSNEDDLAAELVDAGLWDQDPDGDGYRFHDWDDYQAAAATDGKASAGRIGGLTRALREAEARAEAAEQALGQAEPKQNPSTDQAESSHPPKHGPEPVPEPAPDSSERDVIASDSPSDDDWATDDTDVDTVKATARTVAQMIGDNGHPMPTRGSSKAAAWFQDMDRLLRLGPPGQTLTDPPTPEQVVEVARWATDDEFWRTNIQSIGSLRKHWSRLALQARDGPKNGSPTGLEAVVAASRRAG